MIWFLSDPHGGETPGELEHYLQKAKPEDKLILLGDVGLHFQKTEENERFTRMLLESDREIILLDGNHENFDYLWACPQEDWNGGRVYRLSPHMVLLQRGGVYTIEGKTFFAMGGCKSSAKWKAMGLWYPQESPTQEELDHGRENLEKHGRKVDYVLTHRYARRGDEKDDGSSPLLRELFNFIEEEVTFTHWYAGHWHKNEQRDEKHTIVFGMPVPLL